MQMGRSNTLYYESPHSEVGKTNNLTMQEWKWSSGCDLGGVGRGRFVAQRLGRLLEPALGWISDASCFGDGSYGVFVKCS
jgi:hypothetical protein